MLYSGEQNTNFKIEKLQKSKSDFMKNMIKPALFALLISLAAANAFAQAEYSSFIGDAAERELIQTDSLPDKYFKVVVSGDRAVAVEIFEKKTDRLIQKIVVDCEQRGAESVSVGDFNFDGLKDFSIFESSYAGPNTSSLYYLYDPVKRQFFDSKYEGTSLEFDGKTKLISATNQCCAGRSVVTETYKVVKNKMVLVSEQCYVWDDKKGKQIERPMKRCQ